MKKTSNSGDFFVVNADPCLYKALRRLVLLSGLVCIGKSIIFLTTEQQRDINGVLDGIHAVAWAIFLIRITWILLVRQVTATGRHLWLLDISSHQILRSCRNLTTGWIAMIKHQWSRIHTCVQQPQFSISTQTLQRIRNSIIGWWHRCSVPKRNSSQGIELPGLSSTKTSSSSWTTQAPARTESMDRGEDAQQDTLLSPSSSDPITTFSLRHKDL